MKYYRVEIAETSASHNTKPHSIFNKFDKCFETIEQVVDYFIKRYNKLPRMAKKIYREIPDKSISEGYAGLPKKKAIQTGFTFSFWNSDYSHSSLGSWHQTDWIEIYKIEEEHIDFKLFRKELFKEYNGTK